MKKRITLNNIEIFLTSKPNLLNCDHFFKSAVLIPIFFKNDEMHILFEIRSEGIRQPGEVCFPGGEFDENDKIFKKTAIREAMEELSLKRNQIKYLGKLGSFVNVTGVLVEAFIGQLEISDITELEFRQNEVAKVFSMPISYFKENLPNEFSFSISINPNKSVEGKQKSISPAKKFNLPEKYHNTREINGYPVYLYETQFGVIWGITAFLLMKFVERINIK